MRLAFAAALMLAACKAAPPVQQAKAKDCTSCHATEAAEWSASMHRVSFTDRDFQASFEVEPEPFCFDCHAPLATRRGDTEGEALGIGCASCHGGGHGREGHGAKTSDCSGCHEFSFPHRTPMMQSTLAEHAASPFADVACASCHMPRAKDGHRDHRFDVTRNETALRAAIEVTSTRTATGVSIRLRSKHVGHKFPTGDLFRRIRVFVRNEALDEEEVVLGRRFQQASGVAREIDDTRIDGERTVNVDGEWVVASKRIAIEVRYERVAQTNEIPDARGGMQRRDAVFAGIVLAETILY